MKTLIKQTALAGAIVASALSLAGCLTMGQYEQDFNQIVATFKTKGATQAEINAAIAAAPARAAEVKAAIAAGVVAAELADPTLGAQAAADASRADVAIDAVVKALPAQGAQLAAAITTADTAVEAVEAAVNSALNAIPQTRR